MSAARKEIAAAYRLVDKVLQPLTRGDGDAADVKAARVAVQSLHLLRQWARLGAEASEPFKERLALHIAELVASGAADAEMAARFGLKPIATSKKRRG